MSDNQIPPSAPAPQKHYVLVMTAAVVVCDASSEMEAAQRALLEGAPMLDPKQLQWVVKFVSEKPIYLGEDDGEDNGEAPSADTPTPPKLEIVQ